MLKTMENGFNNSQQIEFNSIEKRRSLFLANSTKDGFFFVGLSGAYIYPNYFCTFKECKNFDFYFLFKRDSESFNSITLKLGKSDLFSISKKSGVIYENYQFIESCTINCEFIEPDYFIENAHKQFQHFFNNLKLDLK